jgi:hypothetical protein
VSNDTWGDQLEATAQELHDLAANTPIKLVIEGELGDITGTLYIEDAVDGKWSMVASVVSGESPDGTMAELVRQFSLRAYLDYKKAVNDE